MMVGVGLGWQLWIFTGDGTGVSGVDIAELVASCSPSQSTHHQQNRVNNMKHSRCASTATCHQRAVQGNVSASQPGLCTGDPDLMGSSYLGTG